METTPVQPRRSRFGGAKKTTETENTDASSKTIVRARKSRVISRLINQIPDEILNNEQLNEAIKLLPSNYNFEIHKTVFNIKQRNAKRVCLQMPEGLLIYAPIIADILQEFCSCETLIMGDVSYGACCIDDYTARALDCDFIVHYAHSCLVPIDITLIKVLYVFVTIAIDEKHLINTIRLNFNQGSRIALFGTIQFNPSIHSIRAKLSDDSNNEKLIYCYTPQIKPLSKGEVLGCTSAYLDPEQFDAMIYIGDGRFHLESAMIHNPKVPAYRYDPYSRKFTREGYDKKQMIEIRQQAIDISKDSKKFGIILGALGRQGNPVTVANLEEKLKANGKSVVKIVLSEIFPQKMAMFDDIDAFVQVACPRLSIDWGYAFNKPLLTPYEAMVLMGDDKEFNEDFYPMDYYESKGYGRGQQPVRT
ncbi:2-(3-amino-3-carboxypropyl)histidine synthase [Pichia kluyveri]|uniref:2-(3-amino-3-carboxypropyl)histidine synthase subunit 1 n=1 Tax=Pichia kluyveri TaxID=36015 RepID=A0AAV5RB60_PICKL|nr:2-(3-amino-3-carboxypropyl)histidine synthase [Pichia kluyveri]